MSTTQPTTFADLVEDLSNRVRSDTSVTATQNIAKRFVNIGLRDMHIGSFERFPWAEREAVLVTHPRDTYAGGTVSTGVTVNQGATAVSFGSVGVEDSNAYGQAKIRNGGVIRVNGTSEPYRLSDVTAGGLGDVANLDSAYIGDDGTFSAFEYWEDEYDLASDFLRPVDVTRFSMGRMPIRLIGRNQFRNLYPRNDTFGSPHVGTLIDRPALGNTTPRRRIRLHPVPADAYRIRYSYITSSLATASDGTAQTELSADADEPIVPLQYRMLIVYHGLYCWYRDRSDDPTRAQQAKASYDELLSRVRSDTEIGQSRPQLRPNRASYVRSARRPWGSGTRRFDLGNFDYGGE